MKNGAPGGHEKRNPSGHEKRYPEPFRKTKCGHEKRDSEGHEFWHLVLNKNFMTIKRRISRAKTDTEIHVKIHAVFHDPQNLKFHDPNSKFHDPREPIFHSTSGAPKCSLLLQGGSGGNAQPLPVGSPPNPGTTATTKI